jgi:hypothetical protein
MTVALDYVDRFATPFAGEPASARSARRQAVHREFLESLGQQPIHRSPFLLNPGPAETSGTTISRPPASSQVEISVSRLSAILKARACSGVR